MSNRDLLVDALSEQVIDEQLDKIVRQRLGYVRVVQQLSSTNAHLLDACGTYEGYGLCVTDCQTAGRGRNGREWYSPAGSNVYLSVAVFWESYDPVGLSCLSLACGVAVCEVLQKLGADVRLKWPNDIMLKGRKLGGLLLETRVREAGVYLVVGLGLNVRMQQGVTQIDQPWADLADSAMSQEITRNQLVAQLVNALVSCLGRYRQSGFDDFREKWRAVDMLMQSEISLITHNERVRARVMGLAEDCGLSVEVDGEQRVIYAADVKLKLDEYDLHRSG